MIRVVLLFAASLLSGPGYADAWSDADALFAERENDRAKIREAREMYLTILDSASGAAAVRAVTQLGRLAVYEGEMLLAEDDIDGRREIFQECWCRQPEVSGIIPVGSCEEPGFVEAISPDALGEEHPAYYYYSSICMGYWGKVASTREKLAFTGWLTEAVEIGQTLDTRFEGGGIDRVAAGMHASPAGRVIGLYDPEASAEEIERALSADAYPGDPNSGADYFENWDTKYDVLYELDEVDAALELVTEKLEEWEELAAEDELPEGRVPESKWTMENFKRHYFDLTGETWE